MIEVQQVDASTAQSAKIRVMQALHVLLGLFQGTRTHQHFTMVFDWFYPEHFGVVKNTMAVYSEPVDDDVVLMVYKLLSELADNSSHRIEYDSWSINGLIVYKEVSSLMIAFL